VSLPKSEEATNSWKLCFLPIEVLRMHEEISNEHLDLLYREILRDGVLKKPLLVENKYLIILDGHHRYVVLRKIGARIAPVFLVDYSSPDVEVYSWREDWRVTKEMVIEAGLKEKKLPFKTSRHIVRRYNIPEINIPLSNLVEGWINNGVNGD